MTTSIEENCFPKKEFLKFVEEQLESLSTQLSKYGKASIELAAKASENRDLEKKLAQLQDQMTEMSKSYEEEVTSLKEQLEKSRSALVKAEAEAKRMEAARADEMAAHKKLTKQKMREKFDEEARAYRQQVDQEMAEELARIRQGIQEANSDHVILPETQDTEVVQETQFDEHGPQLDDHVQYIPESQENVFGEMLFSNRMQPESPSHGRSVANMSSRLAPPGTTEPSSQKRKAPQPDSNNGNTPKHKKAAIDAAIPAYQGRSRVVQDSQSPSQSPSQTPGTGPSSRSAAARRTKSVSHSPKLVL